MNVLLRPKNAVKMMYAWKKQELLALLLESNSILFYRAKNAAKKTQPPHPPLNPS